MHTSDVSLAPRTVLLADADGVVQVIVAADDLLDLKQLEAFTGRPLKPLNQQDVLRAHRRRELAPIDGSRHCFAVPTIVDQRLTDRNPQRMEADRLTIDEICALLRQRDLPVQQTRCTVADSQLRHKLPEPDQDKVQIRHSIQNFTTLRIRQRLEETLEIPPLSPTAERILQLRANPHASANELTAIVESDPSLAAQVVSWASSPYYAAPGRVASVRDAIVRVLGFELVSNLAVGLVLSKSLAIPADRGDGIPPYWGQAVYCSMGVETLMRLLPPAQRPRQGLMYLTGLLHNFGYLVLAHTFPPHFSSIRRHIQANPTISHIAVEYHILGISREQIGAWLLQAWRMPEEVVAGVRHQHDPDYAGTHAVYPNLIYMAQRLLHEHGIGDAPSDAIPDELFSRYGLRATVCREAIGQLVQSREATAIADQMSVGTN